MATIYGTNNDFKVPSLDLRFADRKNLVDTISGRNLITFSRDSIGTYVDENGVIQSAASGAARFDHDPETGESLGLLVEESRTNSVTYSSQMLQAFTATEVNVTPNAGLAPDGTNTAVKIAATTAANYHFYQDAVASASLRALSLYVKSAGENTVFLGIYPYVSQGTTVDLSAGTASGGTITPVGNGWYRISYTVDYGGRYSFVIMPGGRNQNAGDGTSGILVWGPQLESGASFPTSYIPTRATFTSRASTATYYDANGIIQTAAIDEARDDAYFPDENDVMQPAGLLLEGSGTNLVTNSTSVTATGGTATLNGGSSPDGGTASILLTANQTGGYVQGNSGFTVSTVTDHTISFWYKDGTGTATSIRIEGVLNGGGKGYFTFNDLNDGTNVSKGSTHTDSYGIQVFPNEWKRFYMGYNSTSGTNNTGSFTFKIRINGIQDTQTCYLFGLQAETGTFPTSYIPTAGSTVTRAADVSTSSTVTRAADVATLTNNNIYNTEAFTITNEPFGASGGSNTLSLVGPNIKRTSVYSSNLSQATINKVIRKTDEFWRWRVTGSSFGLPNFTTDGQVTVDWGDGTVETLTASDHTFTDGGGYHDIGFRLDSGTYFRPFINANASHNTKVVALGPAPESMKLNGDRAFYGCGNLEAFDATVDATGGTSFYRAWRSCSSLTSFPLIDTSSGTTFDQAWYDCSSLTSFPLINTSSSTNFNNAWYGCSSLTSFPLIDTSAGTSFSNAWYNCSSLTSFPLIDTSSGTSFSSAWRNCSSLTSFPLINTAAGTSFNNAWNGCNSLTSFPLIDTSSGTNFNGTWRGCSNLTSFPLIDTSSGVNFGDTWLNCSGLTSFPLIDTSSGTNFYGTWNGCSSLTSFPLINISNGTYFYLAWNNCVNLTTFPANFFDSWTGTPANNCFANAWNNCSSLTATSVENILNSIDTSGQSAPASGVDITIDYDTGTGTPSVSTAVTNLKSRGWTITLNGVAQ